MTLTDVILQIRYRLGNRSNLDQARILNELILAQTRREMSPFLPWWLMQFFADVTFSATVATLAKPANYIREHEEHGGLWVLDTSGYPHPLKKRSPGNLYSREFETPGMPAFYGDGNSLWYIFATPDQDYAGKVSGYYKDTALAIGTLTNDTNLWLTYAPLLLISEVCMKMAMQLQMPPAVAQGFGIEMGEEEARILDETVAREEAWQDRNMGAVDAGNFNQ